MKLKLLVLFLLLSSVGLYCQGSNISSTSVVIPRVSGDYVYGSVTIKKCEGVYKYRVHLYSASAFKIKGNLYFCVPGKTTIFVPLSAYSVGNSYVINGTIATNVMPTNIHLQVWGKGVSYDNIYFLKKK